MPAPSLSSRRSAAGHRKPPLADDDLLILPRTVIAADPVEDAAPAAQSSDTHALPTLLSIAEVAAYFGRDVGTIRRWTRRGELHAVRIGGARVYRAEDIRELLVDRRVAAIVGRSNRRNQQNVPLQINSTERQS